MVRMKDSWFSIECKDVCDERKLAPGMNMICDVTFAPEERRDYKYEAVFAMGIETFTVPILGNIRVRYIVYYTPNHLIGVQVRLKMLELIILQRLDLDRC